MIASVKVAPMERLIDETLLAAPVAHAVYPWCVSPEGKDLEIQSGWVEKTNPIDVGSFGAGYGQAPVCVRTLAVKGSRPEPHPIATGRDGQFAAEANWNAVKVRGKCHSHPCNAALHGSSRRRPLRHPPK